MASPNRGRLGSICLTAHPSDRVVASAESDIAANRHAPIEAEMIERRSVANAVYCLRDVRVMPLTPVERDREHFNLTFRRRELFELSTSIADADTYRELV